MSGSATAAAFITMIIVFMVGLFAMCVIRKINHDHPQGPFAGPPGTMLTGRVSAAKDVRSLIQSLQVNKPIAIVMHTKGCTHCKRLIEETIQPLGDKLPMDVHMLEITPDLARVAQGYKPLQTMIKSASGVPATLVVERTSLGQVVFSSAVGYMGQDQFMQMLQNPPAMQPLGS